MPSPNPHDAIYRGMFPDHEPIFVVGAARSGTSITGAAIRHATGLPGDHESYLFSTANLLMSHLETFWRKTGPGLEQFVHNREGGPEMQVSLARFDFDELLKDILRHFHDLSVVHGEKRWVDKTPDPWMIHATPVLAEAYPNAKFVFCRRHAIPVLESRRRTHPENDFEFHCREWTEIMRLWYEHAASTFGERGIDVDQRDLATDGPGVARRLAAFLGYGDDVAETIADAFANRQIGRTTKRPYDDEPRLVHTFWSEDERRTFVEICGPMLEAWGYEY